LSVERPEGYRTTFLGHSSGQYPVMIAVPISMISVRKCRTDTIFKI